MKRLFLSICFLVVVCVQGQNFWTEVGPFSISPSFVPFKISVIDQNTIWIYGKNNSSTLPNDPIWCRSTDGGVTWTSGLINLGNTNLHVSSFQGVNSNTAYVTAGPNTDGAIGGIWVTQDAGTTWTQQDPTVFSNPFSYANIVHFWDENKGVAIGDPVCGSFQIYTTNNGGINWIPTPSNAIPAPFAEITDDPCVVNDFEVGLSSNFQVVNDRIWFATSYGRLIMSDDFGLSWSAYQAPIPDFGAGMNGLQNGAYGFSSENNGLLIVSEGGSTQNYYRTTNGGASWQELPIPANIRSYGLYPIPGLTGVYYNVGELNDGSRGYSLTTDGGDTYINLSATDTNPIIGGDPVSFVSSTVGYTISDYAASSPFQTRFFRLNDPLQLLSTAGQVRTTQLFSAAPNPAVSLVSICGTHITKINLYDLRGTTLKEQIYFDTNDITLDLSDYAAGIYFLKAENQQGDQEVLKIIKN